MKDNIKNLVGQIMNLPSEDFQELLEILVHGDHQAPLQLEDFVSGIKSAQVYKCPYCGSTHIVRNGHRPDGVQKFRCCECHRSFVPMTNTIFAHTHKPLSVWQKYIGCVLSQESIRSSAKSCGFSIGTSFFWRHKILSALCLMEENVGLEGIAEGDETFFPLSFKGNHKAFARKEASRAPRKRGGEVHTRGLSKELVCVPCAVDRNHRSISRIACMGACSAKALSAALDGKIKQGSILCADDNAIYRKFAAGNLLNLVQIKGGRKVVRGQFHIQHLNSYHSMMKKFMRKFQGVSSKYLNGYLAWHNFLNYAKEGIDEKARILKEWLVNCSQCVRIADISALPTIKCLI